ncbi:MAG: hypothetical protein K8S15_01510 [Candidatus Aegiribacteria sp.]|nr:hypothetical protein [Candidatus Aegiribacteria sp.]
MKILFLVVLVLVCLVSGFAIADDDGTTGSENAFDRFHGYGTDAYGDAYLTTLFARDNGFAGNSFNVSALTPLTIVGFDCNLEVPSVSCDIFVYYKVGTADGFEQNSGAWTLLGTDNVIPAGSNLPTHVDVGGLYMDTGDTVGLCIISSESNVEYTNGGPNTYTNADMSITTLRGLSDGWPPSSVFAYRVWNGTVHYIYGTALVRNTWGSIKSTF